MIDNGAKRVNTLVDVLRSEQYLPLDGPTLPDSPEHAGWFVVGFVHTLLFPTMWQVKD